MITLPFRLGVAFHSFAGEYCSLRWSFEDLMELTGRLGGGVEIVGPSHQRGYPFLTPEFERVFKSAIERWSLTPTCYGSYADPFAIPGRDRSPDEQVAFTLPQLEAAAALGFPIVRLQYFASAVIEQLLPTAERLGLKLGYELHSPLTFESDAAQRLIEQIDRLGSPNLGIIPDCGIFARSVTRFHADRARRRGVPEAVVQLGMALWSDGAPLADALPQLEAAGLTRDTLTTVESFWGSLGRSDPARLIEYMPVIVHMHGKFFSMVDGDEPDIRYRDVVAALIDGGYNGWLSSEFEGDREQNSFLQCAEQQQMLHRFAKAKLNKKS
jgi:sugar phosphate isomerase/epimerase